ncbi:hypothetical protein Cfor_12487, partial [Coptotermes formosanus]
YCPQNLASVSAEHRERFHQGIREIEEIPGWTDCEHGGRLLLDAQEGKQFCRKLQNESNREEISSILR